MHEDAGIYARESEYLDRAVQVGHASGKVLRVSFPADPDPDASPDLPLLDRVEAYLEGAEESFADVDVALTMATDRRAVLERLREVRYGEEVSVEQLARMTPDLAADEEADLRTVREALAENPAPLVVPDHRVRDGPGGAPAGVEQRLRSLEGL
jgi:methylated-DNA-[protein]-cysteine S-methyltransferase